MQNVVHAVLHSGNVSFMNVGLDNLPQIFRLEIDGPLQRYRAQWRPF